MQKNERTTMQDLPTKPSQDNSDLGDAARIGWIIEERLGYIYDYKCVGYEWNRLTGDLAVLGRIVQEVIFAQTIRASSVDTVSVIEHGSVLPNDEHMEILMFLDRMSSALFTLKEHYQKVHQFNS